jgi:hypothetical protein
VATPLSPLVHGGQFSSRGRSRSPPAPQRTCLVPNRMDRRWLADGAIARPTTRLTVRWKGAVVRTKKRMVMPRHLPRMGIVIDPDPIAPIKKPGRRQVSAGEGWRWFPRSLSLRLAPRPGPRGGSSGRGSLAARCPAWVSPRLIGLRPGQRGPCQHPQAMVFRGRAPG